MRIRYHDLVGKRVITSDGRDVGRVADLSAEAREGRLYVSGLLVGPTALLRRIAFRVRVERVPWEMVARIGDRIYLRVTKSQLDEKPDEFD